MYRPILHKSAEYALGLKGDGPLSLGNDSVVPQDRNMALNLFTIMIPLMGYRGFT